MYDVYKIREQFPMLQNKKMQNKPLVYLDNSSTTFKPQCVIDAITNYYTNATANSHRGDYDLAYNADKEVRETREVIAKFVNCDPNEVIFTSGSTMASNIVAYGYGDTFIKAGDEIILEETGHASSILPWYKLAKRTGVVIKYVDLDEKGRTTAENLQKAITSKTKIVALAHVTNTLGYEIDLKKFAEIIHKAGAVFVVDGAQSIPHVKVDFKDTDIDFLFFSAHKMCGPTGVGCLIGKYDILDKMDTFLVGGGMNETFRKVDTLIPFNPPTKFEAGTLDVAGIMGFKVAVEFIMSIGIDNIHAYDVELKKYALEKLKGYKDIIIYNADAEGASIIFNIKNVFAQDESTLLNYHGIAIRSGQHCAKLMDTFLGAKATLRMSTYLYTTKEEIDAFVDAVINGGDILDAFFN